MPVKYKPYTITEIKKKEEEKKVNPLNDYQLFLNVNQIYY